MGRQQKITRSIRHAILSAELEEAPKSKRSQLFAILSAFFALYYLKLVAFKARLFQNLRTQYWKVNDDEYKDAFKEDDALQSIGDMGYSGSTFFATDNECYLVKSIPREFEHTFFRDDLLEPYIAYMASHPASLLVRILEFLASPYPSIGSILSLAPSHHIVMENLIFGQQRAQDAGGEKWGTWDLKPTSYFFPERDIAGGRLASEATKSKLADKFDDKIVLTRDKAEEFWSQLEQDTKLLEECNAVDYSLFLVRIPLSSTGQAADPFPTEESQREEADLPPTQPPFAPPTPPTWRTGVNSADGKYAFRAAVLDFFWAKHKVHAKVMTGLVNLWRLLDRKKGPMSITTTPQDYRERFLKMCHEIVEVKSGE